MFPPWPERDQGRSEGQGITAANPAELDELVRIGTWSESCYAFAHYTDDELADGIMAVHTTIDCDQGRARGGAGLVARSWRGHQAGLAERPMGRVTAENDRTVAVRGPRDKAGRLLLADSAGQDRPCGVDAEAPIPEIVQVVQDAHLPPNVRWPGISA
jgi:hypothetical protein